jgi:hypothetical protein
MATAAVSQNSPARDVLSVTLTDGSRLTGRLVKLDDQQMVLKVGAEDKSLALTQVQPLSVYMAKRQTLDLSKGATHLELARFLLANSLLPMVETELGEAVRLDKGLSSQAAQVRAAAGAAAVVSATGPTVMSARSPGTTTLAVKPPASAPTTKPHCAPATPGQIEANTKLANDWFEKGKEIVGTMHLVETQHFLLYSAWNASNDAALSEIAERMYAALCRQFDVPLTEQFWAGKFPIYIFWEADHFKKFSKDVVGFEKEGAAGFCGSRGKFVYVVLGPARDRNWFFELMIHETTHGFISRYLCDRGIPTWVNEGMADLMASTLVEHTNAARRYVDATRDVLKRGKDPRGVLKDVELNEFDYGIAQSFVRFLIAADREKFIKFFGLLKDGQETEAAMKEAYNWTLDEFIQNWARTAAGNPPK